MTGDRLVEARGVLRRLEGALVGGLESEQLFCVNELFRLIREERAQASLESGGGGLRSGDVAVETTSAAQGELW